MYKYQIIWRTLYTYKLPDAPCIRTNLLHLAQWVCLHWQLLDNVPVQIPSRLTQPAKNLLSEIVKTFNVHEYQTFCGCKTIVSLLKLNRLYKKMQIWGKKKKKLKNFGPTQIVFSSALLCIFLEKHGKYEWKPWMSINWCPGSYCIHLLLHLSQNYQHLFEK